MESDRVQQGRSLAPSLAGTTATLAGGCFWCTEAIFKRLKGVISVESGYARSARGARRAGGKVDNPKYEEVSTGRTGYAESVQIKYDPNIIPYSHLLDIFWATHDPTTLNRQGSDVGNQYRSAIFYHDRRQKKAALKSKPKNAVTEIVPFEKFYTAEEYHQNYYERNKQSLRSSDDDLKFTNPYCSLVIDPKIEKLLEKFNKDVKEEYILPRR